MERVIQESNAYYNSIACFLITKVKQSHNTPMETPGGEEV
jgi:hypothetical protein